MRPPLAAALLLAVCAAASSVAAAPVYSPGDEPAHHAYRARPADFVAIQDAMAGALKLQPKLFPKGIGSVDVVLQDTSDFYVYSRSLRPGWKQIGRWRSYRIYRLRGHRRPPEHEMWGCAGGPPSVMEVDDRRVIAEHSVRCAPWGSFHAAQVRKRSYYRYREAYLATLIHELGHQYEDITSADPPAVIEERRRRRAAPGYGPRRDGIRALRRVLRAARSQAPLPGSLPPDAGRRQDARRARSLRPPRGPARRRAGPRARRQPISPRPGRYCRLAW